MRAVLVLSTLLLAVVLTLNWHAGETGIRLAVHPSGTPSYSGGTGILIYSAKANVRAERYGLKPVPQAMVVNGVLYSAGNKDPGLRILVLNPVEGLAELHNFDLADTPSDSQRFIELCSAVGENTVLAMGVFLNATPAATLPEVHRQRIAHQFAILGAQAPPTTITDASWAFLTVKQRQGWVPLAESCSQTKAVVLAFNLADDLSYYDGNKMAELLEERTQRVELTPEMQGGGYNLSPGVRYAGRIKTIDHIWLPGYIYEPLRGNQEDTDQSGAIEIKWSDLLIPGSARLHCQVGLMSDRGPDPNGIEFQILVNGKMAESRTFGKKDHEINTWIPWSVDIGKFSTSAAVVALRIHHTSKTGMYQVLCGLPHLVSVPQ